MRDADRQVIARLAHQRLLESRRLTVAERLRDAIAQLESNFYAWRAKRRHARHMQNLRHMRVLLPPPDKRCLRPGPEARPSRVR